MNAFLEKSYSYEYAFVHIWGLTAPFTKVTFVVQVYFSLFDY